MISLRLKGIRPFYPFSECFNKNTGSKKIVDRLEERINGKLGPRFKSEGERRIAYFLDTHDIRYIYEPPVLVTPTERQLRIW